MKKSSAVLKVSLLAAGLMALSLLALAAEPPFPVQWQGALAQIPTGARLPAAVAYSGKIYLFGGASCDSAGCNVALATTQIYDPATDTWTSGAAMPTARFGLTAVEAGGKIYVMAGRNGATSNFTKNVNEIYDPASNSWTTGASVPVAVRGQAAAAYNGKIYVFGGADTGGPTSGVNIYDPAANSWSAGPAMPRVGYYGTAVTVGSKIYYCGGGDGEMAFGTVLVYDPAAGSWGSTTYTMPQPAQFFGAAADTAGKIYMFEGEIDAETGDTYVTQVLDTAAGTWSEGPLCPSPLGRDQHVAVTLNGKIYLLGGASSHGLVDVLDLASGAFYEPNPYAPLYMSNGNLGGVGGKAYLLNGAGASGVNDKVYVLDTAAGSWSTAGGTNPKPRFGAVSDIWDGKLVFADGGSGGSTLVGDAYLYDPATNAFTSLAVNSAPRLFGAGGVVNGVLYTFAGTDTKKFLDTARALDLTAKTWSDKAKVPRALTQPCGCAVNGKVYIIGGLYVTGGANAINPETYVYDPAANSYTTLTNKIPWPVYNCAATAYGNYVLVMGDTGGLPDKLQVLDTAAGTWTLTNHSWNRSFPNMMVQNDKLYITSGEDTNNYYADRTEIAALTSGPQPLRASASANPTSGEKPLAVQFTGNATGGTAPYTYSWNFGDGSAPSTVQSPSHTYTDAGAFTATLTVTDSASGTATGNVAITVTGGSGLTAIATADVTSGNAPLAVQFTGAATGGTGPYTYLWVFGDGSTNSTDQSPSHTYTAGGTFTVAFTVRDSTGATATDSHIHVIVTPTNPPPVITSVTKQGNPFRFIVAGSNLQNGIQLFIGTDTTPWTSVTWKTTSKVKIGGGSALKAKVPKGVATPFRFVNPDGGTATFTVQW